MISRFNHARHRKPPALVSRIVTTARTAIALAVSRAQRESPALRSRITVTARAARSAALRMRARPRHRRPPALISRIGIATLAALALAAGFIFTLAPASAAPAAAVTALADRAAAFPVAAVSVFQDKILITRARARAAAQAAARAAAVLAAHTYTVRSGDSLSSVAARHCGTARDWTGIYAASRAHQWTTRNANVLTAGQHLYLSCAYLPSMLKFAPAPPPPPVVRTVTVSTGYHRAYSAPVRRTYHRSTSSGSYGNVSASNYSGFQACVIARESGGNSQVMNSSSHYGLYQFSESTWQAYGGSAGTFGHASVAEQNRIFGNAMARGGQSNWSPYDGCLWSGRYRNGCIIRVCHPKRN